MADKKISELTSITGADVDDANDTIAIVDSSAGQTKKITREELFKGVAKASFGTTIDVGTLNAYGSGVGSTIALFGASLGTLTRNVSLQAPTSDSGSEPFIWNTGNSWLFKVDATDALLLNSAGSAVFEKDASINGLTVGRGSGDVSTNTANGYQTLLNNTTGVNNAASGYQALRDNTTGSSNTASGSQALRDNTTGSNNVAVGYLALKSNVTGAESVAVGVSALRDATGNFNTGVGRAAGEDLTTGSNNTLLGYNAQVPSATGSEQIAIRAGGVQWLAGAGTPEGAITADVGSMFTRTDGGAGTTLYVKESGTGNTGWVAK